MKEQSREFSTLPAPAKGAHIIAVPGHCGGKPHIAGHRIKVQHIAVWYERLGMSPAEIGAEHPGITLADIHAALAYYHDHRQDIDADIEEDARFVMERTAKAGSSKLQQKLAPLHGQDDPLPPG
jgi:uncharacterized protein (DUF433 family)